MNTAELVKEILVNVLQLGEGQEFSAQTPLLGAIPEFDSMAVVSVITGLEETFDFYVEDDEISAEVFASFGSLCQFVKEKC